MTAPGKTALVNVRVFDGHRLTEPRTVVIDGPVIGTDPTGAQEVDGAGAVLLPGLIDAHVHLHGPESLDALARWGVTTGLDMACWPPELIKSLHELTGTADFRTAGLPAIGPDGNHARLLGLPAEAVILTPEDARRHVEARVAEGVDYIKGVAEAPGDGGPAPEALQALVAAAHAHGLKTVVHAATVGACTVAAGSGADFVTHVPVNGVIRPEDIAAMRAGHQVAVPTLTMMEALLAGRAPIDGLLASVAGLHRAGIEVLAGTDANAQPGVPGAVPHGESLHHELELLARAGLSPVEVLRSATVLPARAFGLTDRGAVERGLRADLVLVDGDPTTDITATREIRAVWCAGHQVAGAGR
ncbi:amidohydrolase family protein [Amycolatopsis saalfeldensis]|uniref:Imidazolonepropionase n=1 Tax=Amycolatopsis saalfeldensis TaxID=394193 RepID=A0A1H8VI25_9PSEU|nr:amidohydrolase family protein [Amycolatopsis saalfeldensis]SEP15039.1 Imidazolonepropionase [Amycolatopsis saalfeldensis]